MPIPWIAARSKKSQKRGDEFQSPELIVVERFGLRLSIFYKLLEIPVSSLLGRIDVPLRWIVIFIHCRLVELI